MMQVTIMSMIVVTDDSSGTEVEMVSKPVPVS